MTTMSIALFNATGLPKQAISAILKLAESSSILLITETWLLHPNRYPTSWKQFHTYGQPSGNRGSLGITLLINPSNPFPVQHIPHSDPLLAKYTLSFTISKLLIHCLYLPPSLSRADVSNILDNLPLEIPNTTSTIICGDLNARMGVYTGDTLLTYRGRILHNWIQSHNMVIWNERLKYGSPTIFHNLTTDLIPHSLPSFTDRNAAFKYIENYNATLCQAIYESLDEVCGRNEVQKDDRLRHFWTTEMQETFDLKESYYKKWRKAHGLNSLKYWLLHQETKARLRRMILQRRKETWQQFCDQMEQDEYTKAIAKLCKIRKNRTLKPSFSTTEGPQHAANVMTSHLRSIYSGHLLQEADRTFSSLGNPTTPFKIETCPITLEDIHTSLKRLPPKKSPGIDQVRQEMLIPIQNQLAPTVSDKTVPMFCNFLFYGL
ncbi:hypothetical protein G6F43_012459 [Rhizopus delemar]|nr:hypothetical protein G6F43_012459 [Rhizopus delemar]